MVDSIYRRKYSLVISTPEENPREGNPTFFSGVYGIAPIQETEDPFAVITSKDPTTASFDYRIVARDAIEITDLQLQATIAYEKDVKSSVPQQATITVFNLSDNTQ